MTCDRVVIVNRGQVVAEDTPSGLSQRMAGAERFAVTVRGPRDDVAATIALVPGIARVNARDEALTGDDITTYDVDAEPSSGSDLVEAVAAAVVGRGWGLREMRRQNLSLEDVFLQLTTSEPVPDDAMAVAPSEAG